MNGRVEVIPYTCTEDEYVYKDGIPAVRVLKKGDMVVSHGVNIDTGRVIVLPQDDWRTFTQLYCVRDGGAYFLKEE